MTHPYACAFCGAALDPKQADALMGLIDCGGCGKLAQLDAAVLAAVAAATSPTQTVHLNTPNCESCAKQLQRNRVVPEYGIARCDCGVITDLSGRYRDAKGKGRKQGLHHPSDAALPDPRALARPNPGHLLVRELPGALDIAWRNWAPGPFVLMGLFLCSALVMLASEKANEFPIVGFVLGAAVSLAFGLYGFAVSLGRLHFTASKEGLRVTRKPFPWLTRTIA